jgi:hypothetical protein
MNANMLNYLQQIKTSEVTVKIDAKAWYEGWAWSLQGGSSFDNPYPLGTSEAYSWVSGFIGNSGQAANH